MDSVRHLSLCDQSFFPREIVQVKVTTMDLMRSIVHDLHHLSPDDFRRKYSEFELLRFPNPPHYVDIAHYAYDTGLFHHLPFLVEHAIFGLAKYICYARSDEDCLKCVIHLIIFGWLSKELNVCYNERSAFSYACERGFEQTVRMLAYDTNVTKIEEECLLSVQRVSNDHLKAYLKRQYGEFYGVCLRENPLAFNYVFLGWNDQSTGMALALLRACHYKQKDPYLCRLLSFVDHYGDNLLHYAICYNDLKAVKKILETNATLMVKVNLCDRTPLFYANTAPLVEYLSGKLTREANYINHEGMTCRMMWHKKRLYELDLSCTPFLDVLEAIFLVSPPLHRYLTSQNNPNPQKDPLPAEEVIKFISLLEHSTGKLLQECLVYAMRIVDCYDNNVLHVAALYNHPILPMLMEWCPNLMHQQNKFNQTPYHVTEDFHANEHTAPCEQDVMQDPNIVRQTNCEDDSVGNRIQETSINEDSALDVLEGTLFGDVAINYHIDPKFLSALDNDSVPFNVLEDLLEEYSVQNAVKHSKTTNFEYSCAKILANLRDG